MPRYKSRFVGDVKTEKEEGNSVGNFVWKTLDIPGMTEDFQRYDMFMTHAELAERWRMNKVHLVNYVKRHGPPYSKIGIRKLYRISDILEHEKERRDEHREAIRKFGRWGNLARSPYTGPLPEIRETKQDMVLHLQAPWVQYSPQAFYREISHNPIVYGTKYRGADRCPRCAWRRPDGETCWRAQGRRAYSKVRRRSSARKKVSKK